MSSRSWVTSSLVRRPEIVCWVFRGRTPRSLMLLVGQALVARGKAQHVVAAVAAEFEQLATGLLLHRGLRPGHARHAREAGEDRVPELMLQRFQRVSGDDGKSLPNGPPTSSTRPGCPAASPPLLLRPLRCPALLPGRLPSRQVIRRRRHRGVPAVPRPGPQRRFQLPPQVSDHHLERRDPLRLLPDQRVARIRGRLILRRVGHSRQSSRNRARPGRQHRIRCRTVTNDHSPQRNTRGT
jgi:hypothetical protein